MRKSVAPLLTLSALVAGTWLSGCASRTGAGDGAGDHPPPRIVAFLHEAVGYLTRRDLVDVGDPAPDFELMSLRFYDFEVGEPHARARGEQDPYQEVRLSAFAGKRPVALVFGSYT